MLPHLIAMYCTYGTPYYLLALRDAVSLAPNIGPAVKTRGGVSRADGRPMEGDHSQRRVCSHYGGAG